MIAIRTEKQFNRAIRQVLDAFVTRFLEDVRDGLIDQVVPRPSVRKITVKRRPKKVPIKPQRIARPPRKKAPPKEKPCPPTPATVAAPASTAAPKPRRSARRATSSSTSTAPPALPSVDTPPPPPPAIELVAPTIEPEPEPEPPRVENPIRNLEHRQRRLDMLKGLARRREILAAADDGPVEEDELDDG